MSDEEYGPWMDNRAIEIMRNEIRRGYKQDPDSIRVKTYLRQLLERHRFYPTSDATEVKCPMCRPTVIPRPIENGMVPRLKWCPCHGSYTVFEHVVSRETEAQGGEQ
jgi:5-methylcytosine-specific restriction endonuclease McrA